MKASYHIGKILGSENHQMTTRLPLTKLLKTHSFTVKIKQPHLTSFPPMAANTGSVSSLPRLPCTFIAVQRPPKRQVTSRMKMEQMISSPSTLFPGATGVHFQNLRSWKWWELVRGTMWSRKKIYVDLNGLSLLNFRSGSTDCLFAVYQVSSTFKSLWKNRRAFQGEIHSCLDSGRLRNL